MSRKRTLKFHDNQTNLGRCTELYMRTIFLIFDEWMSLENSISESNKCQKGKYFCFIRRLNIFFIYIHANHFLNERNSEKKKLKNSLFCAAAIAIAILITTSRVTTISKQKKKKERNLKEILLFYIRIETGRDLVI